MRKTINENRRYSIINIILILIILEISLYIYTIIKEHKDVIAGTLKEQVNDVITVLKTEQTNIDKINKNEESNIIFPLVGEENNIESQQEYELVNVKNNRYFYNQLNENSKSIYDAIEKNLDNMKTGTYNIKLPKSVSKVLQNENGQEQLNKDFQSAWDAISLDRVDIFFIDISKINLIIEKTTYLENVSYNLEIQPIDNATYLVDGLKNKEMVNNCLTQIGAIKNDVLYNLTGSTYDKILKIHDWIIESLDYSTQTNSVNPYNIYGAMVQKTAVCEGYAETLKYLLDEIDIPCVIVTGTATNSEGTTENHAWNYVQIDGKWYAIDATWDDPVIKGWGYISNSTKHQYFLKGSNIMKKNHVSNGKVSDNGQTFEYPYLQVEEYNY